MRTAEHRVHNKFLFIQSYLLYFLCTSRLVCRYCQRVQSLVVTVDSNTLFHIYLSHQHSPNTLHTSLELQYPDQSAQLSNLCLLINNGNTMNSSSRNIGNKAAAPKMPAMLPAALGFILGCIICTIVLLGFKLDLQDSNRSLAEHGMPLKSSISQQLSSPSSVLDGTKILICIAAFDFSQLPHLEEVLDAYSDLCAAGAYVDVIVHATMPYPVSWIDMLNTRFDCDNPSPRAKFQVTISLQSPALRLHLVDVHRPLMYENIDNYDLFIYTEDDIRVTPRTVATYLRETERVKEIVGIKEAVRYNVGIVRYEYNFPSNVVMDDKVSRDRMLS